MKQNKTWMFGISIFFTPRDLCFNMKTEQSINITGLRFKSRLISYYCNTCGKKRKQMR